MTIVEQIFRESELPAASRTWARDTMTLGWQDRTQSHGRRCTDSGVEFGTSLPRGTVLRAGDCFCLDADRLVVFVLERAEPVFVIEPRSLVCPDVPGVEPLLQQHQMPYVRSTLPFTPAATVAGHQH